MVVTCDIHLEKNSEAIYYAGQVIMGKVTLAVDKVKQVEGKVLKVMTHDKCTCYICTPVNLKINGSAMTRWRKRDPKNCSDTTYCGQVDYINTLTCLLAPNTTDEAVIIEPGIHTFSFACHLPVNCPSSFEGDHGSIRYGIQVSLVRPWKFDHNFMKTFTVLAIKDLNDDSSLLKLPFNTDNSKIFCYGPCKTEPLRISVKLPQAGFVPGQVIPVSILVTNETNVRINRIFIHLVMAIDFLCTHPREDSKSITHTISDLKDDRVQTECIQNFNYLLPIPATPPTCQSLCNIIKINYHVVVVAKLQGILYRNLCTQIPVIIGNVPLPTDGVVVQQQPLPRHSLQEMDEIVIDNDGATINENVDPWSAYANIPAPEYKEASFISRNKLDTADNFGAQTFIPKYPVFNIGVPNVTSITRNGDEIDHQFTPPPVTDPDKTTWL